MKYHVRFLGIYLIIIGCTSDNLTKIGTLNLSHFSKDLLISTCDSLYLLGLESEAVNCYKSRINVTKSDDERKYGLFRLAFLNPSITHDTITLKSNYLNALRHTANLYPTENEISEIKSLLASENKQLLTLDKANFLFKIGNYYYDVNFKFDSAWLYTYKAVMALEPIPSITPIHFEIYDQFQNMCINKRKIPLGLSYNQSLCDFESYYFKPDKKYRSRATQNLGFYLFRVKKFKESEATNIRSLKYAIEAGSPKLEQEAFLSQYFNYLSWNDPKENNQEKIKALDQAYISSVEKNGDLANYNRVRANYYYFNGDYGSSIPYYEKSIEYELAKDHPSMPILSSLYYQLSEAYESEKQFEAALESYGNVTSEEYDYISDLRVAEIYFSKYRVTKNLDDWNSSYYLLLQSDSAQYDQMDVVLEDDLLIFFNYRDQINKLGMSLAHDWYERDSSYEALDMFYTYSEYNKNALMQQEATLARTNFIKDIGLRDEAIALNKRVREANALGYTFGSEFNDDIRRLDEIYSTLEDKTGDLLRIDLPRLNEIRNWSKDNDFRVISMSVLGNQVYMLIIHPEGIDLVQEDFGVELYETTMQLIKYHSREKDLSVSAYQKLSHKLHDDVFNNSIGDQKNVIYSPDGLFNFLNIETLVSDTIQDEMEFSDLKYLILDHEIRYSSEIRSVINHKKIQKEDGRIAVFAFTSNETLGSDNQLNELPGTIGSARAIKKLYPNTEIYAGKKATRSNFFKVLNDPEISTIHLAVHGASSGNTREDVKLFFRTPRGEIDTLYGYELMGQETSVEKVILASCESAKGIYEVGEGAYTLTRYFKSMGVKEVISQLWAAEDAASSYIYKNYYRFNGLNISKTTSISSQTFSNPKDWGNIIVVK